MSARGNPGEPASRVKELLLTAGTATALCLGTYSLLIAAVSAGKVRPLDEAGLVRTAVARDHEKIRLGLGPSSESDVVYVTVDSPMEPPDPGIERATRQAASTLVDSGVVASVRRLMPTDPDFATVVRQNAIRRFPAVLVVKRGGGIVLVTEDPSAENLVQAFRTAWGKRSDCGAARDEIY